MNTRTARLGRRILAGLCAIAVYLLVDDATDAEWAEAQRW